MHINTYPKERIQGSIRHALHYDHHGVTCRKAKRARQWRTWIRSWGEMERIHQNKRNRGDNRDTKSKCSVLGSTAGIVPSHSSPTELRWSQENPSAVSASLTTLKHSITHTENDNLCRYSHSYTLHTCPITQITPWTRHPVTDGRDPAVPWSAQRMKIKQSEQSEKEKEAECWRVIWQEKQLVPNPLKEK